MISKRTITVSIITVLSLLLTGAIAFLCLFLFIPKYVESTVIPGLAKENNINVSSLQVRSIGLRGAEISDIKIGNGRDEDLTIDSIRLDYSISGLLDRRIDKIMLGGISVDLEYKNNKLSVTGLDSLISNKNPGPDKSNALSDPFNINQLYVTSSKLRLHVNEKKFIVPFSFYAAAFNQYNLPDKFSLSIYPNSYEISVEGSISNNKNISINLSSSDLYLNIFEDVISEIIPLDIAGQAEIELTANISHTPISITDLSASCRLKKATLDYQGVKLRNPVFSDNIEQPIMLNFGSRDLSRWEYSISPMLFDSRQLPFILEISGFADFSKDIQKGNLKAVTRIMNEDSQPEMKWDISAERQISGNNYKIIINGKPDINGETTGLFKGNLDNMLFSVFSPEIDVQTENTEGILSGSYFLKIKNIESAYNEINFSVPAVSIKGNVNQSKDHPEKYTSSFQVASKGIVYEGFDITMNIPDYQIKGTIVYDVEKVISTDARISLKNGSLSMPQNSLKAGKLNANIPFHWPIDENSRKGRLSVEKIKYKNFTLGPVDIDISQNGSNIPFSGTVKFPLLPEMVINITGDTAIEPLLDKGKLKIDIPAYRPSTKINLGRILPALKGFYYNGNLTANSEIHFSKSDFVSGLAVKIDNGTIENSEKDLRLENLSLNLMLEDLLSIKSPFGQRLKIDRISFGDIRADDFTLDFKVEGPSLIFIEKGSFKWCGGRINLQSFRLNPEKEEYDLTLFCDRLKLAEILAQFGVANASGGGTVNGKLPIKISKNKISFEDGFLYSTPGGGGKINITGTEILTTGLNPNSAEYAQMDIAREALKAFDYTWVKMSFETEKDELVLQLQFDGKPESMLPFRYSNETRRFVRVDNVLNGSDFKGISLDVNFRVPLDRILNIKDVLDMIE